jgi:hypothetical protein
MGRFDEQMSRMKGLMNYGIVSENTNNGNSAIEYTAEAADGKIYGIVREGTKFFIKRTEKGKESLAESFDYIGGFNNKKDYEYTSYNNALKQFELKIRSINEAITGKGNFNTFDFDKKENLVIEATDKMAKEIARQRQIMANVGENLNEATISISNTGVPEAPKTTSFSAKLGKPFDETASATLDKDMKKTASDPKAQSEPFGENEKAEEFKDAQYVPQGSVANQKPTGGKVVRVNEGVEDALGFDDEEMPQDDIFASEDEFEGVEGDEVMDDDTIEMDDEIEGDVELDGESEMEPELDDADVEIDSDLEDEELESDEDRLDDLEMMIQQIMDELGLDDEESDDEDLYDDEESDDEDDLYDDEESDDEFEDDDLYDDEESDDEMPEELNEEDDDMYPLPPAPEEDHKFFESRKRKLDSIVEAVTSSFMNKTANKPTVQGTVAAIQKAKAKFAAAIQDDLANREDGEMFSDLGYYDEEGNLMDSQEDADDLLNSFNTFADAAIAFYNSTMSKYQIYKGAGQLSNKVNTEITEDDVKEVYGFYSQVAELYTNALTELLDVRNEDLLDADNIMDDDGLLPNNGDIKGVSFISPDQFIEGVDGQAIVENNNFGEYSPYYVYLFYAVMKAVNTLRFNFEFMHERVITAREAAADKEAFQAQKAQADKKFTDTEEQNDEAAWANAAEIEKNGGINFESRKSRKTMKEDKLNVFGKHPGYRKKPMNLPPTGEDNNQWGRDWNDESVYSEEPFGSKIGSSAPFDIVQNVTDSIMEQIKKKR